MGLGEENKVPGLRPMLQKINPQPVIRDQKFPRFADRSQPRRLPGAENFENLHENVDRNPVEVTGRRGLDIHNLEETVVVRRRIRGGFGGGRGGARSVGDGVPNLSDESGHGCGITGGVGGF